MNVLSTTWRQLVRLRLWPVAVLLAAALVAVPVLLTRDAAPVADPGLPATSAESSKVSETLAEPVVAQATTADRARRRRVLGLRKNPFQPAPTPKPKKAKKAKSTRHTTSETTTDTAPTPSPVTSPPVTTPAVPVKPKKTYVKGSLIVRFGDATAETLNRINLQKLAPLPDDEEPLLVYTGLTKNGKKAKFLVDATLDATGDGTCRPHPSNCETIELAPGETEFFDFVDPESGEISAQYELDLVAIK
jgi:hypothetical protein